VTGGPFDDIAFNFYRNGTPSAQGNLFILTQEYLGTPSGLSTSTQGFLAESTGISGGIYQFAPTVTLSGSTQYFFYADQGFTLALDTGFTFSVGREYVSFSGTEDFIGESGDVLNFLLTGTPTASPVPEPSTAAIAVVGAITVIGYRWSRHRRAQRRRAAI
jgi:hypothetical protein